MLLKSDPNHLDFYFCEHLKQCQFLVKFNFNNELLTVPIGFDIRQAFSTGFVDPVGDFYSNGWKVNLIT